MRTPRLRGCLAQLLGILVLCVALVYGVAAIMAPWAFHIGSFSRLHLDGLRPTGGVQGTGSLCTSRGVTQYVKLGGTIFNGWRSTEGSLIEFRLLEPKYFDVGQGQGFFDLYGRWQGSELVMDGRGRLGNTFHSGLKIEQQSVTLDRGSYSDFKAVCASETNSPAHR